MTTAEYAARLGFGPLKALGLRNSMNRKLGIVGRDTLIEWNHYQRGLLRRRPSEPSTPKFSPNK